MSSSEKLLDRSQAAAYLSVSTRTLDRYVQGKNVNTIRRKGKIFFSVAELSAFKNRRESYSPHVVGKPSEKALEKIEEHTEKYKILWEAARKELEGKEKILFELHRRLGFLEAELKNSVPLLLSQNSEQILQEKISEKEKVLNLMRGKLRAAMLTRFLLLALLLLSVFIFLFFTLNS